MQQQASGRHRNSGGMKRIYSIDFTRGLVMIIMALDHVRDLIHVDSIAESPTNLSTTTPILFFTRWITHLCAPIFVFLAGTSAFLSFQKERNIVETRKFLMKRGIWLLLLEFTVVNFGMFFDAGFHLFIFEVIGAFGVGFIVLSLLLPLSATLIGITGLVIIFAHGLFPLLPLQPGTFATAVGSLFSLNLIPLSEHRNLLIAYPPIPWLGIMLAGYGAGQFFRLAEQQRRMVFLKIGAGAVSLFLLLRAVNVYGDPSPWTTQKDSIYTFLSFLNVSKYPPSLLFCLITLGIMFLILFLAENANNRLANFVGVYGKVPLFYFIVHFYLIHLALLVVLGAQGFSWSELDFASGTFGRPKDVASGLPVGAVHAIWIAVVLVLYFPCRWYWRYKASHSSRWLRYL